MEKLTLNGISDKQIIDNMTAANLQLHMANSAMHNQLDNNQEYITKLETQVKSSIDDNKRLIIEIKNTKSKNIRKFHHHGSH